MSHLILEPKFDSHQKTHLSLLGGVAVVFTTLALLTMSFFAAFVGLLVCCGIAAAFISKKGLVLRENKIYSATFVGDHPVLKSKINLKGKTAFGILKFKKNQKMAFFSAANPDYSHTFGAFDIYLLNKNHTQKEFVLSLKEEGNSLKASDFLEIHTPLKLEVYSPNFYA